MKIILSNNKKKIKLSRKEWLQIGRKSGWTKKAFGEWDTLEIGSTPTDEPCAQLGSSGYDELSRMEIKAFHGQIMRLFPNIPAGARFISKSNPHDFGVYRELAIKYLMDDEESSDYAINVENGTPANWDEEAKRQLTELGYFEKLSNSKRENEPQPKERYF